MKIVSSSCETAERDTTECGSRFTVYRNLDQTDKDGLFVREMDYTNPREVSEANLNPNLMFGRAEYNKNRTIIIRDIPIVTYDEVKSFMGQFTVANIAISRRLRQALVTLKHGEEAEKCVTALNLKKLKEKDVHVSLYRNDNLLCVANLPLSMEETDFRKLVEPCGPIEKGFLMRKLDGTSLGYGFVEFMHNRDHSERAQTQIHLKTIGTSVLRCQFVKDNVLTFDQLYSKCLIADGLPDALSSSKAVSELFGVVEPPICCKVGMDCNRFLGFVVVEFSSAEVAQVTFGKLLGTPLMSPSVQLSFSIPGETISEVCTSFAATKTRLLPPSSFLPNFFNNVESDVLAAGAKGSLPNDLSTTMSPLIWNLLQQNPAVSGKFVELMRQLGQQQQQQLLPPQRQAFPDSMANSASSHGNPNPSNMSLCNPNLQVSLLSVMLAAQLQQCQPAILSNPSLMNQIESSQQNFSANPFITQANVMLQGILANQAATANQILTNGNNTSQIPNFNQLPSANPAPVASASQIKSFDSSWNERFKLPQSTSHPGSATVPNAGFNALIPRLSSAVPLEKSLPSNNFAPPPNFVQHNTFNSHQLPERCQPRPILGMKDNGQATSSDKPAEGPASPIIAQAIETSIRERLQSLENQKRIHLDDQPLQLVSDLGFCSRKPLNENHFGALRRSKFSTNTPKRSFKQHGQLDRSSNSHLRKRGGMSEIQKRKQNAVPNKVLQPLKQQNFNNDHLTFTEGADLTSSSFTFREHLGETLQGTSCDAAVPCQTRANPTVMAAHIPVDCRTDPVSSNMNFMMAASSLQSELALTNGTSQGFHKFIPDVVKNSVVASTDRPKEFLATPGRKRPHVLPSPEPSPEGPYVGQHSQGIGGHYADSYFKHRKF